MDDGLTILVLAKTPRRGAVKTRLIPRYGANGAAFLASAALQDTLCAVENSRVLRRFLVLDGSLDFPVPDGITVIAQTDGTLDQRIAAALSTISGPALLIGMDTPQVTPDLLEIDTRDRDTTAWLGLAADGGWWALGLRHPARDAAGVCLGVPMSTSGTGRHQWQRLTSAGLKVAILPTLRDVDEPDDVPTVAALAPASAFASAVRRLNTSPQDATA